MATEYEVVLANNTPPIVWVEADEVGYDAHWVTFKLREKQEPTPPVHCEACGEPTGVQRVRPAPKTVVAAIFPANQVRRVTTPGRNSTSLTRSSETDKGDG